MLNEKPNVRHRIGSARTGSSRVGSAHSNSGRASSARPSTDSHRPKLHTGRPSSAPPVVPKRPSSAPAQGVRTPDCYAIRRGGRGFLAHGNHVKTHDVSHLNLKVEGKSIRSVSYVPRRHQPVSRGSLRVVSSHGYSSSRKQKQFLSDFNLGSLGKPELGSDSDGSGAIDFGKTYTIPLSLHHPMIYGSSVSLEHQYNDNLSNELMGSTYTKADNLSCHLEDGCGKVFPHEVQNTDERKYGNKIQQIITQDRDGEGEISDSDPSGTLRYDETYFENKDTQLGNVQGPLSNNSHNIRPHLISNNFDDLNLNLCNDSYRYYPQNNVVNQLKRDADTTSNDGSECTVISLGRKIQLMAASSQPKEQVNSRDLRDTNWDSEWKQLLKQNHELLLKLSSREDPQISENNIVKCDHMKTVLVHHSSVQTSCHDTLSYDPLLDDVKTSDDIMDKSDSGICSEFKGEDESYQPLTVSSSKEEEQESRDSLSKSEVAECVLEDIIEESSSSCKSTPRNVGSAAKAVNDDHSNRSTFSVSNIHSSENCSTTLSENISPTHVSSNHDVTDSIRKETSSASKAIPLKAPYNSVDFSSSKAIPLKMPHDSIDFSCTTDLPTYRLGAAAGFAMKSLFPYERKITKPHPSKDLLQALQMIEDEEKKAKENREKEAAFTTQVENVCDNLSAAYVRNLKLNTKETEDSKLSSVPDPKVSSSFTPRDDDKFQDTRSPEAESIVECAATLPVLQVLVEKVFLFTQDLAERWQLGEVNGKNQIRYSSIFMLQ